MFNFILGKTNIVTPKNAFGALPIQRADMKTAIKILQKAYEGGMTFFDTARLYSDSEEKLGNAFVGIREKLFIATKTASKTPDEFWQDLNTSLSNLKTDYIDLYQFHWPSICYMPGDGTGMYECMLEAKKQGKIRHIGFTNHSIDLASQCIESGLYETLQYPFSYLSTDEELKLVEKSKNANIGFIAMKALAGGLITNSSAAFAFMSQFDNVLPIWGIQHESELDEFLKFFDKPAVMTDELNQIIEADKKELAGEFCRGCGYCMPCPMGIQINSCARIALMIKRMPADSPFILNSKEFVSKIEDCTDCGQCKSKCPYNLDTPELLRRNLEEYKKLMSI